MKMTRYILLFALLAILSCTNEEEKVLHEVSVSFNPVLQGHTRATNGDTYPEDTPFGVWAFSLPTGNSWAEDSLSATPFMENETVNRVSGKWQTAAPYVWYSNSLLTFFAYSPATVDATFSPENGITVDGYDTSNGTDLLFTRAVADNSNLYNNGCIALPFVNAFSKVVLNVRSMASLDRTLHLKKVYIEDLAYKGTFRSLPAEHWTATADRKTFEFYNGDIEIEGSSMNVGELTLLPQKPGQPLKLIIDIYKDGELIVTDRIINTEPIDIEWGVGKLHEYTLDVYSDTATFTTDILTTYDRKGNI